MRIFAFALLLFALLLPAYAQEPTPTPATLTPTPFYTPTPQPRPAPSASSTQEGLTLELFFTSLAQGQIGLARVSGPGLTAARADFLDKLIEFFPVENDGFYGLLTVGLEQSPRLAELRIYADSGADSRQTFSAQVQIVPGDFIRQEVTVVADRAYLLDPQIERNELARLEGLFATFTLTRYWRGGERAFPIASPTTSPFGAFRIFNGTFSTRHTGWDLRAAVGTPVMAMASGVVAFAGLLDLRGAYVLIDHGYGVFSGYAHFSQTHVTRGQQIVAGQIIGVSGDTGRSNGPHLHWEVAINGDWVDSLQLMTMWLP
ncbi:MAG: M23 family metallopeptidase [Chloroflexi bacterium]|nr:M23 family metallopeptidase [Chloroflexota bacterium]